MSDEHPVRDATGMPVVPSWDSIGLEQLKLYASELSSLYKQERELRRELETKTKNLEFRVRELSALNAMWRQHLDLSIRMEDSLRRLVSAISTVSDEANLIVRDLEKSKEQNASDCTTPPPP